MSERKPVLILSGGFPAGFSRSLTWRGFAWSLAAPMASLLLFYTFVLHVRLSLGRWPAFGERLNGWLLVAHEQAIWVMIWVLALSFYTAAAVFGIGLFRRWNEPLAIYALGYASGFWLALLGAHLAPRPFLDWFLD